jgi:hypothetical protein
MPVEGFRPFLPVEGAGELTDEFREAIKRKAFEDAAKMVGAWCIPVTGTDGSDQRFDSGLPSEVLHDLLAEDAEAPQ